MLELEDHVELATARVREQHCVLPGDPGHLSDCQVVAGSVGEDFAAHLLHELVDAGSVGVVRKSVAEACVPHGTVGEVRVLGDEVDDVHAEAVDATVEPPAHHGEDGLAHLGVLPVEVGLLGVEQVQVVLTGFFVEGPGGAGEERLPVRRFCAGGARCGAVAGRAPPVPVALGVVRARA
ncbi:hypothetical protein D3C74_388440 [compost metagenome]